MNIDHHAIEVNDASSFELTEDDRFADVCEPLYLQPKTPGTPAWPVFDRRTRRKDSSKSLQKKSSDIKGEAIKERFGQRFSRLATKKRIRFARDKEGQILCQYRYFSNPDALLEEETGWLDEETIEGIQGQAQADARDAHATTYHQHLLNLIDGCKYSDFKDTFHTSDLVNSAFIVADSEFRGLEVAFYGVDFLHENDCVVASVLHQQDDGDHVHHLHRRAKNIASTSKSRTKYARRLAYALAYGDAMVAHS